MGFSFHSRARRESGASGTREAFVSCAGDQMAEDIVVSEAEAESWLDGYKAAWEGRDIDLALALFTEHADYRERRFGEPLLGHKTLESYWRDRVFEHQRDITFTHQIWGVSGNECIATWQATFMWLPINGVMQLDGIARISFSERRAGRLVCSRFTEWMDYQEIR